LFPGKRFVSSKKRGNGGKKFLIPRWRGSVGGVEAERRELTSRKKGPSVLPGVIAFSGGARANTFIAARAV